MPLTFTPGVSNVVGTASQLSGAIVDPATASQGGTGLTSLTTGYYMIGNGTVTLTAVPSPNRLIAYSSGVLLTTSGDQLLTMTATAGTFIPRRITLSSPNTTLATIIAVATLRTATGGGGAALTGSLVFTGLATTAYLDQAITLASAVFSATSNLCVQITTAIGLSSQTCPVQVYADMVFP